MKTIVAAVDFSETTKHVLATAAKLALVHRARLELIHVLPQPEPLDEFGARIDLAKMAASAKQAARREFARIVKALPTRLSCRTVIGGNGSPVEQILTRQRKIAANFIVVGSHGRSAVYDQLVGSVASGIIKGAGCPVVVVPARMVSAS